MRQGETKILRIDASARLSNSYSRTLTDMLVNKLTKSYDDPRVLHRDIYNDCRFLSEAMVAEMNAASTGNHDQIAAISDMLIEELLSMDILVLAVPVYNFSIPAALKAYIDLVVRAGRTFRYGSTGAQGLLTGLKVYVVVVSNGTPFRGEGDFVSGYLEFILRFIGVNEILFIDGTQLLLKGAGNVVSQAEEAMDEMLRAQARVFN